ncbi:hypothetical protein [Bacillus subtilis]|uniref:hypothetical protein n=1 Tax=Bacillus subtilis TaxID=1423 RepID=UPI0030CCA73A
MYYTIGIEKPGEEGRKISFKREFTREEQDKFLEYTKYLGLHFNNKNLYKSMVKNGEELENFLEEIKNKDSSQIGNPDYVIFESNRLLMNYLSMFRSYVDHISCSLSKIFDSNTKEQFVKFTHRVYDNRFEYRFLSRLRNFAQHFGVPINSLISNQYGNHVAIDRDNLLIYEGWSSVKEEIKKMEEIIPVQSIAYRMNETIKILYLFVMNFYAEGIVESIKWINLLEEELGGEAILTVSDSFEEFKSGNFKLQTLNYQEYVNAVHDLNENPDINIDITQI